MPSRLTAMEIEQQTFRRVLRGYDPEEVELYLRSVSEEVERLNLENAELQEAIGHVRVQLDEHRSREHTLQQTLISAQTMTEALKERSRGEADLIVREARQKAERLLAEAQDRMELVEADIQRCKLERDLMTRRLRSTIEEHLALLDQRRDDESARNLARAPRPGVSEAG